MNEYQLSDNLKVIVGQKVDRKELEAAAKNNCVRIFDPRRCFGTCDYDVGRVNINLDENNVVTDIYMG